MCRDKSGKHSRIICVKAVLLGRMSFDDIEQDTTDIGPGLYLIALWIIDTELRTHEKNYISLSNIMLPEGARNGVDN